MKANSLRVPSLDLSVLDRPETKDHLISLLRTLAESELPSGLPEDPILQLVALSQAGMEQMRLNHSFTSRSEVSAKSQRGNESEREVKKLRREVKQQRRALANYEFFLRQPEVADTVNKALGRLNTLKCAFCHKFFTMQHYLDQHVVRRHPELAGLGAERKTTAATDRRHTVLKRPPAFLAHLEALHKTILAVHNQAVQALAGRPSSEKLREAMLLQQEVSRLLEQQRLLADQVAQCKELLQESPAFSLSESQQTSFFDRASLGEAALESLRSEQSRRWELEGTGRMGDVQEDWRNEAPTQRRLEQGLDLAKIELSFSKTDLAKKKAQSILTQAQYAFCPVKYASHLRSFYQHTEDEVISCRKRLLGEVSRVRQRAKGEHLAVREALEREVDQLQAYRSGVLEPVQVGLEFCEGAVMQTVLPAYVGMVGPHRSARSEHPRESLLSLDYDNSVSFSIRWGDDEEESGEWRGINADEARRLGFFFR